MQTITQKKNMFPVKFWEITPPQETGKKAYSKETKPYLGLSLKMV